MSIRFTMSPRENHLIMAKRILGYLKKYHICLFCIVVKPNPLNNSRHESRNEFYPNAEEEEIPPRST
jgi:hypothetical protein